MQYNLNIKQSYNFLLRASGILGIGYNNATVMAIMDYASAKLIQDVTPIHAQIYTELPVGTPRNASELTYVKIKTITGDIKVIAMEWIASQPTLVTTNTVKLEINSVSVNDIPLIRDILTQNGFTNFTLSVN